MKGTAEMASALTRRDFLALSGAVLGSGAMRRAMAAEAPAPPRKPNIVVILADDLGYAELGCQGCKDIPTPHIDSLGANGVRFTSGYVSCPVCAPTRAGLLTGRYQQRFGFEHNPGPETHAAANFGLPRGEAILPERLKALGYATGMVGKWHVGYKAELTPPQRGFEEFFGFLGGAHNYLPDPRRPRGAILRGNTPVEEKEYLTDAFAREAVAFIDKHKGEPFFLYLPFNAVHGPLEADEKYLKRFPDIKASRRRTYAAMMAALDDAVGRVLGRLREHGLEEHTLIFFHSDNGGPTPQTSSSNAPLRGYKAQMWEGGIRVPFIMQWKGRLPAGKVYEQPVIALDILPTAVAAAGATIAPEWKLDGVNLIPYLTGQQAGRPHETLCWRMGARHAVRHGDWKLVAERDLPKPALFNLAEDIGERNDLAEKMPDKVKELTAIYQAWEAQMSQPQWVRHDGRQAPGKQGVRVADRFKEFDRNGDGKLTADELPRPRVFKDMDANGDGAVTPEEARAYFAGRR